MADVSVRPAAPTDADAIGEVQVAAWRTMYARLVPAEVLAAIDAALAADQWRRAIERPPNLKHRVLVAVEGARDVVGFAAFGPATGDPDRDPILDAELHTLLVHPDALGRGHGSRLLAATVDGMRDVRFRTAVTWLLAADAVMTDFLESAGWAADGVQRDLDMAGTLVRQCRLHVGL